MPRSALSLWDVGKRLVVGGLAWICQETSPSRIQRFTPAPQLRQQFTPQPWKSVALHAQGRPGFIHLDTALQPGKGFVRLALCLKDGRHDFAVGLCEAGLCGQCKVLSNVALLGINGPENLSPRITIVAAHPLFRLEAGGFEAGSHCALEG